MTVKKQIPLTAHQFAFEPLHGAMVFSKLDLGNGYHLVRIKHGDEWRTAFSTNVGHFEYLTMPFGLTNAPDVLQTLVNDVLKDCLDKFMFVYLDDILIFSRDLEEHQTHVHTVLQCLLKNKLYVTLEKCEFHASLVLLLLLILAEGQLKTDSAKVKAVVEWATPASRKHLQCFLGFVKFYWRFIRNYSQVATPLTQLT